MVYEANGLAFRLAHLHPTYSGVSGPYRLAHPYPPLATNPCLFAPTPPTGHRDAGPSLNRTPRCPHCGTSHRIVLHVALCCLFAPTPQGWCAWCGEDAPNRQTFCGLACSIDYQAESFRCLPRQPKR